MTTALEDVKTIDLEEWLTLATAPSSTKLKQGQTPDMKNVWTDEKPGSIITAPGFQKVGQIPSGNPVSFCINYFKTSAGTQTFVVSDNATVWTTVDFQNFTSIITGLSSSFQLRGAVIRDKLWLTNGSDSVRTFDGTTVTVLDGTGGTPAVPKGRYISYHDERVWIYHIASNRSAVYFSSLTDASANIITPDNASAWDITDNFIQVSEGDADFGTGLIIYRGYLFLFKQYSIWRLVGQDEYTYSRVKTRASTGTRFNESIQILDSLIHLIGVDGIYVFDGEESERISDLIDPATASQTAFGFNQLQQPNTNNQFWEVQDTSDWNAGTVPTNLVVDDSIMLEATDDSQADFQAGVTQTNTDLVNNPGILQLAVTASGQSNVNIALNGPTTFSQLVNSGLLGIGSFATDGDFSNALGATGSGQTGSGASLRIGLSLPGVNFKTIVLKSAISNFSSTVYQFALNSSPAVPLHIASVNNGGVLINGGTALSLPTDHGAKDFTIVLSSAQQTNNLFVYFFPGAAQSQSVTEVQVFTTTYDATGKFTSKTLDLGITPLSLGTFNATETLNGETTAYFTQSSADGVSWDAEIAVANGGAIASTPRRYLRWGVNFTSDGLNTPQIDAVYLPSVYLSAIHNTGGGIFAWGPFESDYSVLGQTISFYYRTATTSGGISGTSWNLIVPGGVISDSVLRQYIQFKIEISGGLSTNLPVVDSITINWVTGIATQPSTLQNVASAYWRNRYWLSAAGPGATSNDTILVRGKKTFQSPWMLKDWPILSYTRFFDSLYGGSSVDGSIYLLDSGYSKAGSAMDSYFETGDFVFGGFTANFLEMIIEVERMGSWNLLVGVSFDNGNSWTDYPVDLTLKTFDNNYIKRINLNYTTTRIRFRFRTNGVDTPFQVHRCVVFYKLNPERGSIRGDYQAA